VEGVARQHLDVEVGAGIDSRAQREIHLAVANHVDAHRAGHVLNLHADAGVVVAEAGDQPGQDA